MTEQLRWQSGFCERELAWHFINKDLHSQLISWALWEEYITDLCQTKSTCLMRQLWRWREWKIERCRLLLQKLNASLLGVRNWVYNLCHSGICFSRAESNCGCIMKSIHTLLQNDAPPPPAIENIQDTLTRGMWILWMSICLLTELWICLWAGQAGLEVRLFVKGHLSAACVIQSPEHLTKHKTI